MLALRCVDAHMHLWDLNNLRYPWLMPPFSDSGPNGSVAAIAKNYELSDYFRDAEHFSIEKIVHIEAGAHPDDALNETKWLQSIADTKQVALAIVAHAQLNSGNVEALLDAHSQYKNVRGIRHILNWHPDSNKSYTEKNLLDDPAFKLGYSLLEKYQLSFDLQIYPNQMQQAFALCKAFPNTNVIINHLGMPVDRDEESIRSWEKGMQLLSTLPHVAVKVSGLGFIDRSWSSASVKTLILQVIDWFGTDRVLFASDFPTDKLFNPFSQAFNAYHMITHSFSASERELMFAANAERTYRI